MYGKEYGQPAEEEASAPPPAEAEAAAASPEQEVEAQLDELARSAPPPTKPFSVKALESMVKIFNDTLSKISDADMPEIELDSSAAEGGKLNAPLPPDVFLALLAVSQLVGMVAGGEFADKYGFDPFSVLTDTDVRKVSAQLKMMGKDKKFIEAVAALQEGAEAPGDEGPEDAEMAPPPTDMGDDDAMLAAEMQ